jgi:4'-phosphopantetheinyl transferase
MISEYIEQIQKTTGIDFLNLYLKNEFGSENLNHRQLIRSQIIQNHSDQLSVAENKNIQNLDLPPKAKKLFFSISHNQSLGGYSVSNEPHGFDVELKSRLTDAIILRVSAGAEVLEAPDLKFLWCAKEAAFKALGDNTVIISDLNICHWSSQNKTGLWSFRVSSTKTLELKRNSGFIFTDSHQIFSIFFQ